MAGGVVAVRYGPQAVRGSQALTRVATVTPRIGRVVQGTVLVGGTTTIVYNSADSDTDAQPTTDGAVVEGTKYKNQTCPEATRKALKQIKDNICGAIPALRMGGNAKSASEIIKILDRKPERVTRFITCAMLDARITAILACIAARNDIINRVRCKRQNLI